MLLVVLLTACGPLLKDEDTAEGPDPGSSSSSGSSSDGEGSSTRGPNDGSETTTTPSTAGTTTLGTDGTTFGATTDFDDDWGDTSIPGCSEVPKLMNPIILDATRIRIPSVPVICDEPIDGPYDCSYDQFDIILTVPDTYTPGMWTLPHPDVSMVVEHEWLGGYSEDQGCYCEPPSENTPFEVLAGTITLDVVTTLEGYPMGVTFGEDLDYAPLSGLSTVIGTCG